ncbi:type II toxin-antitoxin system RelE/ParE family toxin [candidate division WOR-3 bacterium]|nr:type II toxin-antitoxin system RelE/ParE family toxin [candidate division WOR-3 bacterium]
MSYSLFILRRAQKELSKIPKDIYDRIKEAILNLSENPRPVGCQKLRGRDGWRIRIGDYRIIYEFDDGPNSITILHIGHRRDIYH